MAFITVAAAVGGGSAILGGALIGAGIGGTYSAITGDGDILNSMLTGGLIGAGGTALLPAAPATAVAPLAPAGAVAAEAGAATTFAPSSTGLMALPGEAGTAALPSATGAGATSPFVTSSTGLSVLPGEAGTAAVNAPAGLTGAQKFGYGLAGTTALSMLGGQNRSGGGGDGTDEYERRLKGYKLSPNYQAYEAPRPNPYYRPTYAAEGGVMNSFDDSSGMDEPAGLAQGNLQKGLFGLGYAGGGLSLGGYSDGGRMLKGPGDGMSDSIPGVIGGKQPARLADGEFVVPADVVSHLGNGSTDAGAKRLYSMMDKIRQARTGKKKQAPQVNVDKYLPMGKASGGITGYAEGGVARFVTGDIVQDTSIRAADDPSNPRNSGSSGTTYSDQRILNAIKESLAQGVGLEDTKNALRTRYGVDDAQLYRVADLYNQPTTTTQTPVTTTQTPQTYSDQEVLNAILASMNSPEKFTLEQSKQGLRDKYGITDAQLYRVADLYNQPTTTTQTPVAPPVIPKTTYSDQQVLDAILESMSQGFTLDQSKQGARDKYGVTDAQLYKVADLYNNSLAAQNTYKEIAAKQAAAQQTAAANEAARTSTAAYRPSFVPRVSGINMSSTMEDPYSDVGLQSLYEQMMGQYKAPTPPMSDTDIRTFAQNFARNNPGKGAELGQALINKGIPVNQAIAATGLSPGTLNTAYIGGQALGTAAPPTLNTQYNYSDPGSYYRPASVNNLVLQNPIPDAATAAANQAKADAANAVAAANASTAGDAGGANRAGGLMSIDRKKRAKYKKR